VKIEKILVKMEKVAKMEKNLAILEKNIATIHYLSCLPWVTCPPVGLPGLPGVHTGTLPPAHYGWRGLLHRGPNNLTQPAPSHEYPS
jgi:hypothetical protein